MDGFYFLCAIILCVIGLIKLIFYFWKKFFSKDFQSFNLKREQEQKQYLEEREQKKALKIMRQKTFKEVISDYDGLSEKDKQILVSYVWHLLAERVRDTPLCHFRFVDTESLKKHLLEHYDKELEEKFVISIVNSKCVYKKLDENFSDYHYGNMLYITP